MWKWSTLWRETPRSDYMNSAQFWHGFVVWVNRCSLIDVEKNSISDLKKNFPPSLTATVFPDLASVAVISWPSFLMTCCWWVGIKPFRLVTKTRHCDHLIWHVDYHKKTKILCNAMLYFAAAASHHRTMLECFPITKRRVSWLTFLSVHHANPLISKWITSLCVYVCVTDSGWPEGAYRAGAQDGRPSSHTLCTSAAFRNPTTKTTATGHRIHCLQILTQRSYHSHTVNVNNRRECHDAHSRQKPDKKKGKV